jgi:rhodanese-related sulfurtransferase
MIREISVEELSRKLQARESVYLLDVRQPWEHEFCRLGDSTLIPLPELPHRLDEVNPPKGSMVVVYCHHGIRSMTGATILQQAGMSGVVSLEGGIDAWSVAVDPKVPRY